MCFVSLLRQQNMYLDEHLTIDNAFDVNSINIFKYQYSILLNSMRSCACCVWQYVRHIRVESAIKTDKFNARGMFRFLLLLLESIRNSAFQVLTLIAVAIRRCAKTNRKKKKHVYRQWMLIRQWCNVVTIDITSLKHQIASHFLFIADKHNRINKR